MLHCKTYCYISKRLLQSILQINYVSNLLNINEILINKRKLFIFMIIISFFANINCNAEEYRFDASMGSGWILNCDGTSWRWDASGHNGNGSIRSSPIQGIGASSICREVKGPSIIRFWWKTDETPNSGSQFSFIDNKNIFFCNSNNWSEIVYPIEDNNSHKLQWKFLKSNSAVQQGAAWIDDLIVGSTQDQPPKINLLSPEESVTSFTNEPLVFKYRPSDDIGLKSCTLCTYYNNNPTYINANSTNNDTNTVIYGFNKKGKYTWGLSCIDTSNQVGKSENRTIDITDCIVVKNGEDLLSAFDSANKIGIRCIKVMNGEYDLKGPILFNNSSIELIGESVGGVILKPSGKNANGIKIYSKGCSVINITFKDFNYPIFISSDNCTIANDTFNSYVKGIIIETGHGNSITGNTFSASSGQDKKAIYVGNTSEINILKNNLKGNWGIEIYNVSDININQNCIHMRYGVALQKCINGSIKCNMVSCSQYSIALLDSTENVSIESNALSGNARDDNPKGANKWDGNYWPGRSPAQPIHISLDVSDNHPMPEIDPCVNCGNRDT